VKGTQAQRVKKGLREREKNKKQYIELRGLFNTEGIEQL
jgi:hypothetical protein